MKTTLKLLKMNASTFNAFCAYSVELTLAEIERCHFEANTINSKLSYRSTLNNKERNVIARIETSDINNVVQRSRDITKSDKLNRALSEFKTLHAHVKHINAMNFEYYDKRTKTFIALTVDNAYVLRHCKHNDTKLRHLFVRETNEKNEFRYIEKNEVALFKAE